ncbi:uncharacterized protein LOC129354978 [Poeciliopsis prolifica]|uniref:uncharacterized protein LOC129354978 n=1 Tax=Poeciliopsis prolifica TaxID=188132 RepID=UPI002413DA7E|nr:uncharacterized protein LOC129354978 [Poeciliopsis prolifica]
MLVPVKTVPLGQPATFTCPFPADKLSNNEVHWYKQSTGDTLKLIVKLRKHADPAFGQEFSSLRMIASKTETVSRLTILKTVPEDEGMYHCAIIEWTENLWHGTYLYFKDGNKHDDCNTRKDSQRRCAFSKNIRSIDNATYYCAVATCEEIFTGNGTKAKVQGFNLWFQDTDKVILPLCAALALSLISTIVLIVSISTSKYKDNKAGVDLHKYCGREKRQQGVEYGQMYSVVVFSIRNLEVDP